MRRLTEATMRGEIPFRTSFLQRVKILSDISVNEINDIVAHIPLNEYICRFIRENQERCYVVTGNLDIWISGLMKKLGMETHCYCSKADVVDDHISKIVNGYRKDIMYVFNYDYEKTGVADSLRKGFVGCRDYIISLDGDTLFNTEDFSSFLSCDYECIPISTGRSAEPVLATVSDDMVIGLSKKTGAYQWPGMSKMHKERYGGNSPHVYEMITDSLPLRTIIMRTREIDTPEDYERAIEWFENGCIE